MKVVLTGFRGTGKTTLGRALAARMWLPFHDTDAVIEERAGIPVAEIFRTHGEPHFRKLEREAVASLRDAKGVIATGGGAVCDPANVENLRRGATVFLLSADPGIIEERIGGSGRPGLTDLTPGEEIRKLLKERRQAYLSASDYCIDTGENSTAHVLEKIQTILSHGTADPGLRNEGISRAAAMGFIDPVAAIRQDPLTRTCGIAGFPCSHSRSPALYNRLFADLELNWHYAFFQWQSVKDLVGLVRDLDLRGLSVTIPFKQDVIPFLDEIDPDAAAIGAVNTVVQCGGRLHGYNTDWLGVRHPLEHKRGARAALFGAGGASAAAAYALQSLEMEVTVLARTPEKARALAERIGCRWLPLSSFDKDAYDVVVNATPVGMEPDTGTLLTADKLRRGMTVFDLVYTPPETPLLREAKRAGCETISGTEMFVRQACEQFRLFTGISVPPEQVREILA